MTLTDVIKQRGAHMEVIKALSLKTGVLSTEDQASWDAAEKGITDADAQGARINKSNAMAVAGGVVAVDPTPAVPVTRATLPAGVETDPYVKDASLVLGGVARMLSIGKNIWSTREVVKEHYGESHPIFKALNLSTGTAGGMIIPPDYVASIIELLRARTVVRAAGPRTLAMPNGTMTMPGQASAATATYAGETTAIGTSQPSLRQIIASYKKLTGLVPITNDMLRYSNPAVDAFVRDDLIKVFQLREDLAFLMGDGFQFTPRGYLSFANAYAAAQVGGVAGTFSATGNSTLAVGGQFISSNASPTQATVTNELAGAIQKLDGQNVSDIKRVWFFNPRTYNYLYNLLNSFGMYVFRDELSKGTLMGYPFFKTTQIPTNIHDAASTNNDNSFVFLVEMTDDMIFDSLSLEMAVSNEASYVDSSGATISTFQNDQTLIRCISEHDHQVRHDESVAIIQMVRWAPASS